MSQNFNAFLNYSLIGNMNQYDITDKINECYRNVGDGIEKK